ncbi:site-specific DNA-methyltransferase [Escherichia coli]|nr:site-specific DNA-methyltransferase [Escherichia coli]MDY8957981.1 site-specific DNA-methyltransferase [Escherichia coli]MDY8997142.1 site-specific DNA-methyltransferase [Escherichia coli]MDY9034209.1 site-specific DNA-methyltransferase [Escherichia coli]
MAEQIAVIFKNISELNEYERNTRTHSDEQVAQIAKSIDEFGWTNPVLIDEAGEIIAGHGRVAAAKDLGLNEVPTITLYGLTDEQKRAYRIADNKLPLNAGWDDDLLAAELTELQDDGFDLLLTGFNQQEIDDLLEEQHTESTESRKGNLSNKFLAPPFSVLNAREGWWVDRKRSWIDKGLQSEIGRSDALVFHSHTLPPAMYTEKSVYEQKVGHSVSWDEFFIRHPEKANEQPTTSVFDPVVCELVYRWFSPPGAVIVDPFAGGSVRGVVAGALGRNYYGCDLRAEQVAANIEQGQALAEHITEPPRWVCGDSLLIADHLAGISADLLFTCPPYADLEVYSDNPADISTMDYPEFLAAYGQIIANTTQLLRNDRFAVVVVGDVRDKNGNYRNFVGDTVRAFTDAGLSYYNEAILVSPLGSLPVRVGAQFTKSRKLGKTHQNILVFVKGDPVQATKFCGEVDISDSLAKYEDQSE